VVTATTSVAHNLEVQSRQTIAGANESGYNGEFIISITDAYTFTYTASGIAASPATGTITTMTAGAGWTKPYSGTNLAAYRQGSGSQHYFRIDDTTTQSSRIVGYETMTAISTGTGPFPTSSQVSGGLYIHKSNSSDATNARRWIIVANDKTIYMWVNYGAGLNTEYNYLSMCGFGQFLSNKDGDVYNTFISASTGTGSSSYVYFMYLLSNVAAVITTSSFGFYAPRSYTQVGTSVTLGKISDYSKAAQTGMGSQTGTALIYPHPIDGGLYMSQVNIVEGAGSGANSILRGKMFGVWNPLHNIPLNHGDIFTGNGDLAGKTFITLNGCPATSSLGQCMIDISLSWD
jgi:hypothetical protein